MNVHSLNGANNRCKIFTLEFVVAIVLWNSFDREKKNDDRQRVSLLDR